VNDWGGGHVLMPLASMESGSAFFSFTPPVFGKVFDIEND
jgi:hypothetical protein